jgi:DNA-binding SARP family transcriptional activator
LSSLKLFLLGPPRIELDGTPLEVDTRKAIAMLAYLAVSGESQRRDTLAALLWPESDQIGARAALRRTLSSLNKALQAESLNVTRESVGIAPQTDLWLDVVEFRRLAEAVRAHHHDPGETCHACLRALDQAAGLYRDHFMTGFSLRDSLSFDEVSWKL